jgi:hypothetical protein
MATHSVGSGQFADGALDAVALMHSFFKRLALFARFDALAANRDFLPPQCFDVFAQTRRIG